MDLCEPVISGQQPFFSLPTDCAQELERRRPLLRHVLEASPEQLNLLPPAARSIAEGTGFRWDENVGSHLMARDMWRLTSDWFEAMEMAATRPATELRTAFLDVDAHFRSQKWLMAPPLIEPYVELAEKSASQALQLDALLELVQTHVATHSRTQPK